MSLFCRGSCFLQAFQEAERHSLSSHLEAPPVFFGPWARPTLPVLRPTQPSALCPRRWMA